MKLVIAEKPAVAMSLATVLGATERKDGYLEGSGYLVSWCVGHLLELAQPEAYKEQYANKELSRAERIAEFVQQIKNPYHFKCGRFTVQASFSAEGATLEECIKGILR